MADPLSIASGIAGVLSLTISIADNIYTYVATVRNASKIIRTYLQELSALKAVLSRLDELVRQSGCLDGVFMDNASALSEVDVGNCLRELERVDASLKAQISGSKTKRLVWPFAEHQAKKDIDMLSRYRADFQMALSADAVAIGAQTLGELRSLSSEMRSGMKTTQDRAIVTWLCPESVDETHSAVQMRRQKETGQWFIKKVNVWLEDDTAVPVFWCRGIPGAGKTVLMSTVVDHALSKRDRYDLDGVAYIYFNYMQQTKQSLEFVSTSILAQLFLQLPLCRSRIGDLYENCDHGLKKPSTASLLKILTELSLSFKILLAFDALDEVNPKTRQALIKELAKEEMSHVLIFVTSRPDVDMKPLSSNLCIADILAQNSDIETYVKARLEDNDDVQEILEDHAKLIIPQIVRNVRSQAAGMFLLVVFQVEYICEQTSAKEMLQASSTMPSEAGSIYAQTLDQIDSLSKSQAQLARKVLSWLVLAKRTLSVSELIEAIAIEPGTSSLDPLNKRSATMLVKVCRGLVVIDNDHIIRLAHLTVHEFLISNLQELISMRLEVANSCLTYLLFKSFDSGPVDSRLAYANRIEAYPFYLYACEQFAAHLRDCVDVEKLLPGVLSFVDNISCRRSYLQMLFSHGSPAGFSLAPGYVTPLHIAAALGIKELTETILSRNKELLDSTDSASETPLLWAIEYNNEKSVQLLIAAGADLAAGDESALNCAARNRRDNMVRLLLEKSMTGDSQQVKDQRHLFVAAITGDEDSVARLLKNGVDADGVDADGGTALQWASWYGHAGVVAKLLASKVNLSASDKNGKQAIHEACESGHPEVVKLLLNAGADVEARDMFDYNPLHRAALSRDASVAEVLLERGADMNATLDGRKGSLLYLSLAENNIPMAKLLLKKGQDVDDFKMDDVLHYATLNWVQYQNCMAWIQSEIMRKHPEKQISWELSEKMKAQLAMNSHKSG